MVKIIGEKPQIDLDKHEWYGQKIEGNSDPLIDPATGKQYLLRFFEFAKNPDFKGAMPSKQELFNKHWPYIKTLLWSDGVTAYEGVEPRLAFTPKGYTITLLCEPRMGTFIVDKARPLHEQLQKKK